MSDLERDRDAYRAAIERALGLIETASSRARILQARDVLHDALTPDEAEQAAAEAPAPEPDKARTRLQGHGVDHHGVLADGALVDAGRDPAPVRGEDDDEPRWLKADPKMWGGGVMSRRRAAPDSERR